MWEKVKNAMAILGTVGSVVLTVLLVLSGRGDSAKQERARNQARTAERELDKARTHQRKAESLAQQAGEHNQRAAEHNRQLRENASKSSRIIEDSKQLVREIREEL